MKALICTVPKAFASTKSLCEGTVESRSIRFNMQARTRKISIKIDKARATTLKVETSFYASLEALKQMKILKQLKQN